MPDTYVGVNVLCVNSGYLITGTISRKMAYRWLTFRRALERRPLRITPELFTVPVAVLEAGYLLGGATDYICALRRARKTLFLAFNTVFRRDMAAGYFAGICEQPKKGIEMVNVLSLILQLPRQDFKQVVLTLRYIGQKLRNTAIAFASSLINNKRKRIGLLDVLPLVRRRYDNRTDGPLRPCFSYLLRISHP